ncbi:MAG: MarR family winged helix-turn-helix transcriptional regulator [Polaromonas sp.]
MSKKSDLSMLAELKTLGCTNFRLRQLMRRVAHHYDLEMAKAGLKTTQFSLLSHVLKLGPLRPGDLAKAMKVSASTLTRNLKPLIDAGWLELSSGSDARSRSVSITAAGQAKREEARHRWKAAQDKLNQLLGLERVLALHGLIGESLELLAGEDAPDIDD